MEDYKLQRLLNVLNIDATGYDSELLDSEIAGISTDSRSIRRGEVLFAIRGDNYDGIDFVDDAHMSGSLFSIVNEDSARRKKISSPYAAVHNTISALGYVAKDYRSMFKGTVVAVTGTNGKTTVKEMLLRVLGARLSVHGTKGNFNNHIGLPLSIFGIEKKHECIVLELGMNAPGEIAYLADITKPDIGVILNVGPGHIGFFESVEEIAYAKMELLGSIKTTGVAVINGDDELLKTSEKRAHTEIVKFGIYGDYDYKAENITIREDGCASFTIEENLIKLGIQGFHNVYNALAVYAVGRVLEMDGAVIAEELEQFVPPKMRMERFTKNGIHFINDSYNANPVSMKAAADVLESIKDKRKIAVLGDMLELGEKSMELHTEVGEYFANIGLEWLLPIGEYSDVYRNSAVKSGMKSEKIKIFSDLDSAMKFINEIKQKGDLVLVKGSRAMRLEKIIDAVSGGD
ncbi:UDP-N-acetylmuramoyl-tripeptide--D-alanyl-D-alanine ligase [Candidatus Latescibacterota bacterium]